MAYGRDRPGGPCRLFRAPFLIRSPTLRVFWRVCSDVACPPSGSLTAAGVSLARALAQRRVRGLLARNPGLPETALEDSVDPLVDLANSLHYSVSSLGDPP